MITAIQRHALHMMIQRFNGVFGYAGGRTYAASNTFDALLRKGLVARLGPDLYAVTKGGRAQARALQDSARTAPSPHPTPQMFLPLGGWVSSRCA